MGLTQRDAEYIKIATSRGVSDRWRYLIGLFLGLQDIAYGRHDRGAAELIDLDTLEGYDDATDDSDDQPEPAVPS